MVIDQHHTLHVVCTLNSFCFVTVTRYTTFPDQDLSHLVSSRYVCEYSNIHMYDRHKNVYSTCMILTV